MESGHDVGSLFLCVSGDDVGVVGFGPRSGDIAFDESADSHFCHILSSVGVAVDLVNTNVVFSIPGVAESWHHGCKLVKYVLLLNCCEKDLFCNRIMLILESKVAVSVERRAEGVKTRAGG